MARVIAKAAAAELLDERLPVRAASSDAASSDDDDTSEDDDDAATSGDDDDTSEDDDESEDDDDATAASGDEDEEAESTDGFDDTVHVLTRGDTADRDVCVACNTLLRLHLVDGAGVSAQECDFCGKWVARPCIELKSQEFDVHLRVCRKLGGFRCPSCGGLPATKKAIKVRDAVARAAAKKLKEAAKKLRQAAAAAKQKAKMKARKAKRAPASTKAKKPATKKAAAAAVKARKADKR
jgi:hypothetical protein